MVASIRKNIPVGKYRVIGCDLFDNSDYIIRDCDTKEEAFRIADDHNRQRKVPMDDVYYVYDDKGNYLRGEEDVENAKDQVAVGVSP